MNSFRFLAGSEVGTTSTVGTVASRLTGARSLRASNGSFLNNTGLAASAVDVSNSV